MPVRLKRYEAYSPRQPSLQHYLVTISTIKKMTINGFKLFISILLTIAFPYFGAGQSTKFDSITYVPKWEVGLDLLGLFNEGNVPKASIFIRRNYSRTNQKCKALRLRIGLDTEIRDGYRFDGLLTGEYATYAPYFSVGHEWKRTLKRNFWYYGSNLSGRYLYSNQYYLVSGDDFYYDVKVRNFDITIDGILGYQINLFRSLSIGIESALIIKYSEEHIDTISNDMSAVGGDDYSRFTTSIQPFMAVNLIYSLQNHKKNGKK